MLALGGQRDRSGQAAEQDDVQFGFQRLDALADRALGQADRFRGGGEAAEAGGGFEDPNVSSEMRRGIICLCISAANS